VFPGVVETPIYRLKVCCPNQLDYGNIKNIGGDVGN